MGLIRYLLLLGGGGMITAAACALGVDCYLVGKPGGRRPDWPLSAREDWRGRIVLVLFAWGAMLLALGLAASAGGER